MRDATVTVWRLCLCVCAHMLGLTRVLYRELRDSRHKRTKVRNHRYGIYYLAQYAVCKKKASNSCINYIDNDHMYMYMYMYHMCIWMYIYIIIWIYVVYY